MRRRSLRARRSLNAGPSPRRMKLGGSAKGCGVLLNEFAAPFARGADEAEGGGVGGAGEAEALAFALEDGGFEKDG